LNGEIDKRNQFKKKDLEINKTYEDKIRKKQHNKLRLNHEIENKSKSYKKAMNKS
jgi:hypothetical protein